MTIRTSLVRILAALALAGAIGTAAAPALQIGRPVALVIYAGHRYIPRQELCHPYKPGVVCPMY